MVLAGGRGASVAFPRIRAEIALERVAAAQQHPSIHQTPVTAFRARDQQIQPATINSTEQTVHLIVEAGTDLTRIIPEIFVSPAATVDPPGGTMQDFTNPFIYIVTSENGQTVKNWTVTIDITTGVKEAVKPDVLLFPNPTGGKFAVHSSQFAGDASLVEVVDLFGHVVDARNLEPGTFQAMPLGQARNLEFDISHLPAGVYFVRISFSNSLIVKKIVKI